MNKMICNVAKNYEIIQDFIEVILFRLKIERFT